uniref:IG domain-containing protein n=1 Tax=Anopheles dirus TaxID=7168 RepID=A0A182NBB1_9DIPT
AAAEIVGAPDLHIDEGSTLRLECKLQRATENPTFVFWYHEQNMVNFDQLNGFSVTPFQSPTTAGHPAHPLQDELDELVRSSAEQEFNLLDDDGFAQQRPPRLGQDSIDPFLADSSSSSLILASLAAAAAAALSSSPYHHHQHHHRQQLDRTDLSLEQDEQGPGTVSPESQDLAGGVRQQAHPHLHHQHHLHHNQHHLAMNYSESMPYSHILTPAPSVLTIKEVHLRHAGNYTCAPSNARPASITVHVLQ